MYGPEIPPEYQPFYDRLAAQSPVVTEGAAASQRPYQDFFSAYERMQQMRQPQRTGPFDLAPDQSNALDRLAAFGAALAGTRRSDFGGAFGEALQAMRQAGTAQRQEERQNRQLDVEAAYRAAQEARQLRELLQYEDPNSLRGRQLRAQIMELEARAERARREAANVGAGERLGSGIVTRDPNTGQYMFEYPGARGGAQTRPLQGVPTSVGNATARAQQADITAAERAGNAAVTAAARTSINMSQSDLNTVYRDRYNEVLRQRLTARERGIDPDTLSAPTEPAMAPIRIQPNQQPIR